jgi:hypothetical protein
MRRYQRTVNKASTIILPATRSYALGESVHICHVDGDTGHLAASAWLAFLSRVVPGPTCAAPSSLSST